MPNEQSGSQQNPLPKKTRKERRQEEQARNKEQQEKATPTGPVDDDKKEKKNWAEKLAGNRYYIIGTLLVVLFGAMGGVPGCYQIIDRFKDHGEFRFTKYAMIFVNDSKSNIVLGGVISNTGKRPIFIYKFDLSVELNGKIYYGKPQFFKDTVPFFGDAYNKKMGTKTPSIDLLTVGSLRPDEAVTGFILFSTDYIPEAELNAAPVKHCVLTCFDVNGSQFKIKFDQVDNTTNNRTDRYNFPPPL